MVATYAISIADGRVYRIFTIQSSTPYPEALMPEGDDTDKDPENILQALHKRLLADIQVPPPTDASPTPGEAGQSAEAQWDPTDSEFGNEPSPIHRIPQTQQDEEQDPSLITPSPEPEVILTEATPSFCEEADDRAPSESSAMSTEPNPVPHPLQDAPWAGDRYIPNTTIAEIPTPPSPHRPRRDDDEDEDEEDWDLSEDSGNGFDERQYTSSDDRDPDDDDLTPRASDLVNVPARTSLVFGPRLDPEYSEEARVVIRVRTPASQRQEGSTLEFVSAFVGTFMMLCTLTCAGIGLPILAVIVGFELRLLHEEPALRNELKNRLSEFTEHLTSQPPPPEQGENHKMESP